MATLVQNVFEGGGVEGKKNALSSGMLDLTIKLLNSRDPVPVCAQASFQFYRCFVFSMCHNF